MNSMAMANTPSQLPTVLILPALKLPPLVQSDSMIASATCGAIVARRRSLSY